MMAGAVHKALKFSIMGLRLSGDTIRENKCIFTYYPSSFYEVLFLENDLQYCTEFKMLRHLIANSRDK